MINFENRVLVVDDMMTMRTLIKKTLQEIGFKDIILAKDGAMAWQMLSESDRPIGLIVSDWNMPNVTGIDFLKKVRSYAKYRKTPFILVTAEAQSHQVAEAVAAGVNNYILKPFVTEVFQAKIEAVFKDTGAKLSDGNPPK